MGDDGQHANGLIPFTFPDSGKTVQIRKVSFLLWTNLREAHARQHPPPEPPLQEVDYGDGRGKVAEPNRADPAYLDALAKHDNDARAWIEDQAKRLYIKRGVVCDVDAEAVKQLREDMASVGAELDPDDHFVYVMYLCCPTPEDYQDLVAAITRRSAPAEETVKAAVASFRG